MEKGKDSLMPRFNLPVSVEFNRHGTGESCVLESADSSRSFDDADFQKIADICSEKLVYNVLFKERFKGRPYTKKDAKEFVSWAQDGWKKEESFVFLIRNQIGEIIAAVDIKSNDVDSAEIGYWSSSKTPGVATNAVIALCDVAKKAGFKNLYGLAIPNNENSQGVLLRAGFENDGPFEEGGKSYVKFSKTLS
ncbi:MAG: GNAT family N-acetyltransferase [Candidatus Woesebacteria bacterium]|jgi:RimJ/RimL family protein N-acetyltransferase